MTIRLQNNLHIPVNNNIGFTKSLNLRYQKISGISVSIGSEHNAYKEEVELPFFKDNKYYLVKSEENIHIGMSHDITCFLDIKNGQLLPNNMAYNYSSHVSLVRNTRMLYNTQTKMHVKTLSSKEYLLLFPLIQEYYDKKAQAAAISTNMSCYWYNKFTHKDEAHDGSRRPNWSLKYLNMYVLTKTLTSDSLTSKLNEALTLYTNVNAIKNHCKGSVAPALIDFLIDNYLQDYLKALHQ